jgi:hypothetical protein
MYPLLLDCFRSGQISAQQWQAHLCDDVFRAWLRRHAPEAL